jgi:hypothetical protein
LAQPGIEILYPDFKTADIRPPAKVEALRQNTSK